MGRGWVEVHRQGGQLSSNIHTYPSHIHTNQLPNDSNPTGQAPRSDMGAVGIPWVLPSDMHPRVACLVEVVMQILHVPVAWQG